MFDPKIFYDRYQVNFHDYLRLSLKYLMEHHKDLHLADEILGYSDEDFILALKIKIRQLYFHSIETVFELIFAFCPDSEGYCNDHEVFIKLSKSKNIIYPKIREIALNKENGLSFLDKIINLPNGLNVSLGNYIFFFGLYETFDQHKTVEESLCTIKEGLFILASEFADTKEYNRYKHSLRIIPALKSIEFFRSDNHSSQVRVDLSKSLTYVSFDEKNKEIKFITKILDTQRDLNMISFCSDLIWNIISIRKVIFGISDNSNKKLSIKFFNKDYLRLKTKRDSDLANTSFSK